MSYAEAAAALADERRAIDARFIAAKAALKAAPGDESAQATYDAALAELQAVRQSERAGRTSIVGGDAVPQEG